VTDRSGHSPPSNPAELRQIFGENLRKLAKEYDSVAGLCRKLEINRTQFNRYLSGESFPRPDILHRIATFFGKDARILLESVDQIEAPARSLLHHPVLKDFFGDHITKVPQILFPNGFINSLDRALSSRTNSFNHWRLFGAKATIPSFAPLNQKPLSRNRDYRLTPDPARFVGRSWHKTKA